MISCSGSVHATVIKLATEIIVAGSEASKTENFNVTIHKVPTSNNTTIAKTTNERTNERTKERKKERKKRKEGRKKELSIFIALYR